MATPQTGELALSPFERQVKQALKLYDDHERLGAESPLASPYFLGRALRHVARPVTARVRGEILCGVIRAAAARLWSGPLPRSRDELLETLVEVRRDPTDPRYAYLVLELRCFHSYLTPYRTSDIWEQPHLLPGSKSQHYRDYDEAVRRLAALLLEMLRPTLRHERPRAPAALYGYERELAQLAAALEEPQSVALTGPGGVGKTSLGAAALARHDGRPAFWYMLRPGFNDGVSSLLFALGAFLHEQGAANLWQYLVTAAGVVSDLNLAAGLLREDLAQLAGRRPIICLDDLEHLASGALGLAPTGRSQFFDLVDALRGAATLLLIGQRALPGSDLAIEPAGLGHEDIVRLWTDAGQALSAGEAERLHAYTGGNPRLLTLLLALRREGEAPDLGADANRSLAPAFQRLWRKLAPEERRALQRLAVYQGAVPEEIVAPGVLDSLERLRLVERDDEGGVGLLPALAPIVHDDLAPELRAALHGEAAAARLERGEVTAAAYHLWQGGQEGQAVALWFPQRRQAIARGEADAARAIFAGIAPQQLGRGERKALDLIRAELHQLAGQSEEGLRLLEQAGAADESEAGARLWMLRGELEDALGYPDRALASYAEGLDVTARLLSQLAILRQRRGLLQQRRRNLQQSWREIHRAEFDLEVLRGLVREEEGGYGEALEAYRRARELADRLDDDSLRAQAERWLAGVYGRRQQLEEAIAHASRSLAIYERLGDRVSLEKMRSNLAFIYVQTRQFEAALEVGRPAYAFFSAARDPLFAAGTGANLAEASYELGDLAGAARYAHEVLALGERFTTPYARYTLGQIALANGEHAEATAQFAESMRAARDNEDPYMVAYAQRSLGQAHQAAGDAARAEEEVRAALELFRQLEIPGEITATEELLAALRAGKEG